MMSRFNAAWHLYSLLEYFRNFFRLRLFFRCDYLLNVLLKLASFVPSNPSRYSFTLPTHYGPERTGSVVGGGQSSGTYLAFLLDGCLTTTTLKCLVKRAPSRWTSHPRYSSHDRMSSRMCPYLRRERKNCSTYSYRTRKRVAPGREAHR